MWGPEAAYFSAREPEAPTWKPSQPWLDGPRLPMAFDISMGVLRGNGSLRAELDEAQQLRRGDVEPILDEFGVPRVDRR